MHGKHNIPSQGFLTYFPLSRNPFSSQNMRKVNSYSTGEVLENTNI